MNTNAKVESAVPVSQTAAVIPVGAIEQAKPQPASDHEEQSRYRLLIEEGPSKGSFVYKTLDAVTGEIVRQFPREQVLKLAEARSYDAGAVIDTSA